ncbi:hypothetical protein [Hymenobacter swuensis]|uniref:Uncharacterized protein n=1 Tax=Hymenobacter swuensis DY53 TaxID=1227739 RepID=W8FBT6_9BACT|nr:hypothetical protein [Hymenobacter swuensis]AHJ99160.1 hypothetical protein Hsw_3565 [Hymenobacter swuensis DY53]
MLRHCLILLLLLPYLAGLGAGLVGRPEPVGPTAAHPYVHSAECQHRNYLRLDCFDTCNGDQQAVQAQHKAEKSPQLLAAGKSIDLHCLAETPRISLVRLKPYVAYQRPAEPRVQPGILEYIGQPPRQG